MIRRPPRSTRTDTLFPTRRSSDLQQIGIAADRRSEMRVVFVGQTKMADLLGTIDSLLQRSQTHGMDDFEVGPVARRLDQAGVIGGGWVVAAIQGQAQIAQVIAQRFQFFRGGPFVYAMKPQALIRLEEHTSE